MSASLGLTTRSDSGLHLTTDDLESEDLSNTDIE